MGEKVTEATCLWLSLKPSPTDPHPNHRPSAVREQLAARVS